MPTVLHIVGARPNFVKMAPLIEAIARRHPRIDQLIVHTGQHYDERLSAEIFGDLQLPEPDCFLEVGSGSHGKQTANVLQGVEALMLADRPDLLVVAGDVNSTLGAALAAAKLEIPVAHLESGLRSFDWTMPEEINRVLTDRLSTLLLTHSPEALEHLVAEGIAAERIHYVGNTMIDSLRRFEPRARERAAWKKYGLEPRSYVLVTLHRPSNVDRPDQLDGIIDGLLAIAAGTPVIFPVHPRTLSRMQASGRLAELESGSVVVTPPLGYLEFLSLELSAGAIVTDSGGVQEEAAVLGVPCYTLRPNTERPITITHGTNTLLGEDPAQLTHVRVTADPPQPREIPLWDGHAGERAADLIAEWLAEITPAVAAGFR